MYNNPLILIIDDEPAILKTLKDTLTDEAYRVETLSEGQKALDLIGKLVPDLILLDIFMPNCNGLTLLTRIKKEYPEQRVIIISGFGNIPIAIEALKKGALDFIEKPLNLDEILNKIEFLKENAPVTNEIKYEKSLLHKLTIIGESHLFLELIQQVDRLAPHTFPILIYGEPGTGKSTLAYYTHKKSIFSNEPFITINCETILQEDNSCLQKIFEAKQPQTIYLQHIDSLPLEHQKQLATLLRQEHPFRIIASSKKSLFSLTQNNQFNNSLFAWLNKAPLEIPPLRKRPYDIPLLIDHYAKQSNKTNKKNIIFNTQSIRTLRNYFWPYNITQLKDVIEQIVMRANSTDTIITPEHIIPIIGERDVPFIEEQSLSLFDSLDQATVAFKKRFLLYLLKKNHYNINQVSSRLQMTPIQLKNKLIELKIDLQKQSLYK